MLIPVFYILPKILYLSPFIALIWIWYLWKLLRIYKLETESSGFEDTKLYLEKKKNYLQNYILRTRLILYISTPPLLFVTLWILIGLKAIFENVAFMTISIILLELLIIVMSEIYVRLVYSPSVKKLNELLKQLEIEE